MHVKKTLLKFILLLLTVRLTASDQSDQIQPAALMDSSDSVILQDPIDSTDLSLTRAILDIMDPNNTDRDNEAQLPRHLRLAQLHAAIQKRANDAHRAKITKLLDECVFDITAFSPADAEDDSIKQKIDSMLKTNRSYRSCALIMEVALTSSGIGLSIGLGIGLSSAVFVLCIEGLPYLVAGLQAHKNYKKLNILKEKLEELKGKPQGICDINGVYYPPQEVADDMV